MMNAQGNKDINQEDFASKLYDIEVLSEEGRDKLNELLVDGKKQKLITLEFLNRAFQAEQMFRADKGRKIEKKIDAEDELLEFSLSFFFRPDENYQSLIHPKRSVYGLTRTRTSKELFEIGLCSKRTFEIVSKQLTDSIIRNESDLLRVIYENEKWAVEYEKNKKQEQEFSEQLVELGLLDYESITVLNERYQSLELLGRHEILKECSSARFFEQQGLPKEVVQRYDSIFQIINTIVPDLKASAITVTPILNEMDFELIEESLALSFDSHGKTFTHKFYNRFINKTKDKSQEEKVEIGNEFYKGVNKYLRDQRSEYRLHFINVPDKGSVYGDEEFGLIVLNKEQADFLSQESYFLSRESYDNGLSTSAIDSLISNFQRMGITPQIDDSKALKDEILANENNQTKDVLLAIPNTIVLFDWETGNLENPYEELTILFGKATRGAFNPKNIVDGYSKVRKDSDVVDYRFTFKGSVYSRSLRFESDWLDPLFFDLIHKAMKEQGVDGKFHFCVDFGQATGFIFLTSEQEDWVRINYPDLLID